jgi:hypothetical protein
MPYQKLDAAFDLGLLFIPVYDLQTSTVKQCREVNTGKHQSTTVDDLFRCPSHYCHLAPMISGGVGVLMNVLFHWLSMLHPPVIRYESCTHTFIQLVITIAEWQSRVQLLPLYAVYASTMSDTCHQALITYEHVLH